MNEIVVIIVLILLNGILSMSEIALISARKTNLSNEEKKGNKSAGTALRLAQNPNDFLSTIQIGITMIGLLTGIYSGSLLADDFSSILVGLGVSSSVSHPLAQVVIIIVVTFLTLVFGELVPKRIGMSIPEKTAQIVARPMFCLSVVTSPFVWLLAKSTESIFNLIGLKSDDSKVTEAEIKSLVEEGTKDGEVQEVEQDIVERVFLLGDLKVSSIMTHRSDVVSLDVNMDKSEIRKVLKNDFHEMYPVVDRTLDCIKGIVTLKNLIFNLYSEKFDLASVCSLPVFIHEGTSVYKVLERMKAQKLSEVLVCDEFGTFQGIVSLNDILEGLVGVIDNYQTEPDIIQRANGQGWLVDGQCALYDFLSYFDVENLYSNGFEFNTVGGLIINKLDKIPQCGESIHWGKFCFEVMDMDGPRIDKVLVTMILNQ